MGRDAAHFEDIPMKSTNRSTIAKSLAVLSTTSALLMAPGQGSLMRIAGAGTACANGTCCQKFGEMCTLDGNDYMDFMFMLGPCTS